MPKYDVIVGDCIEALRTLPAESVQCVVTSPPYWGLRDYKTDGQIGLEETPEEHVAKLVEVFAEVRRVLRADGTCWLNLGDSYVGNTPGARDPDRWPRQSRNDHRIPKGLVSGLKPKDLIGLPWRVALVLQAPYHTGTIRDERDRIWLAAMIDAEGCMFIHKRKAGQSNGQGYKRKNATYSSGLEVANTSEAIVRRCLAITGLGSICTQSPEQNGRRKQLIYRWNLRSNKCRDIIREVYPHLVAKQHEARILLGCPSSGDKASAAHEALKSLHNGIATEVDYPSPESMFEPGWYLRSDVIWKKPNPMPESVTDRLTKAHEYIFLLTKAARYYYDAEAIREEGTRYEWNSQKFKGGDMTRHHGSTHGKENSDGTAGRNKRSVWTVPTQAFPEAHFATYPEDLITPCIRAGTSLRGCCPQCGKCWQRIIEKERSFESGSGKADNIPVGKHAGSEQAESGDYDIRMGPVIQSKTVGWEPGCGCMEQVMYTDGSPSRDLRVPSPIACTVLDPFTGSGTTGVVALRHGCDFIGIELNEEYAEMARRRISNDAPLLNRSNDK